MPRYDVHVFPICTVTACNVEAANPEEAAGKAERQVELAMDDTEKRKSLLVQDIEFVCVEELSESGEPISVRFMRRSQRFQEPSSCPGTL